jgi:hypothetical protein
LDESFQNLYHSTYSDGHSSNLIVQIQQELIAKRIV